MNLDIGLPVQELHQSIRSTLAGDEDNEMTVSGINRRGRSITFRVRMRPLRQSGDESLGVIVLVDPIESTTD
jgi:hypothetical protein